MELVEVEEEGRGRFREDMVLPRCLVELKDSFCLLIVVFDGQRQHEEAAKRRSLLEFTFQVYKGGGGDGIVFVTHFAVCCISVLSSCCWLGDR